MLITGKKRPFRFVLKQEKPLNRGKKGMFHIKTLHERVGEASLCLQPCPIDMPMETAGVILSGELQARSRYTKLGNLLP